MPNPDGTVLEVTLYNADGTVAHEFEGNASLDYVSFVNPGTHGKPPVIAPGKPGDARAEIGDRVLFINTALVAGVLITRRGGRRWLEA